MYTPPVDDLYFVLNELAGLSEIAALPGCEEATPELVRTVLEESGRFSSEVLAPLNHPGDVAGARLADGVVQCPDGWSEAYDSFVESGWNGLAFGVEHGGQGLPQILATAVQEMWHASNMAFSLCPLLTQCAVEAIVLHGSSEQQSLYLPKMVNGEWSGTMCLTEPQAGSDLGAVKTRAQPEGDHYRISGQKIFITYGDHELSRNIVHLVLARTPDAPQGVKGISLFIVPKYVPGADGEPGERNDLRCVSLEHKLGIHGSPTAVMSYGDGGGALGYLVGEENRGLEYMFTMMNMARHAVGLEGVGIAERSFQRALHYARERVQGRPVGDAPERATIVHHPDVKRMLLSMKSQIEAMRALSCVAAAGFDVWRHHPDQARRDAALSRVELLTPVVKGWCTETGIALTSVGVQVHGGMGFIEETGAAQHYRDARITTIYEGTTGIQANDLVGRKVLRDGGAAARALIAEIEGVAAELQGGDDASLQAQGAALAAATQALAAATGWVIEAGAADAARPAAVAMPYLMLWGTVAGGWQMARAALAAARLLSDGGNDHGSPAFCRAKLKTAAFYATHVLPAAQALAVTVQDGAESVVGFDAEEI